MINTHARTPEKKRTYKEKEIPSKVTSQNINLSKEDCKKPKEEVLMGWNGSRNNPKSTTLCGYGWYVSRTSTHTAKIIKGHWKRVGNTVHLNLNKPCHVGKIITEGKTKYKITGKIQEKKVSLGIIN